MWPSHTAFPLTPRSRPRHWWRPRWRTAAVVALLAVLLGVAGWQLALGPSLGDPGAVARALGFERPVTYLVLVQTSVELRATGGFITSVGSVRVDRGRLAGLTFQKVYAAEGLAVPEVAPKPGVYIQPPLPLSRYMGTGEWRLRDANWSADFPTAARQAARFWQMAGGEPVDGVVAVNEASLEAVLDAIGPVDLPGPDGAPATRVDAANLKEIALGRVFAGSGQAEWYAAQSALSQELARAVAARLRSLPPDRWPHLIDALREASRRHDLLLSSFDSETAELLHRLGADGALGGARDDYLYPVEQNVSFSKLSPFIRQTFTYTVQLDAAALPVESALRIEEVNTYTPGAGFAAYPESYYHGARWNPQMRSLETWEGYYGGYTRIYTPAGSRLTGADGFAERPSAEAESGRTVFGAYAGLHLGDHLTRELRWQPNVQPSQPGVYRLLVQRQPGAPAHALTVRAVLPESTRPIEISPPPATIEDNAVTWHGTLGEDRPFTLRVIPVG